MHLATVIRFYATDNLTPNTYIPIVILHKGFKRLFRALLSIPLHYVSKPLSALFRTHEQAKKREYGQRIRDVEHGVFTPLVFSTSGAMGEKPPLFTNG